MSDETKKIIADMQRQINETGGVLQGIVNRFGDFRLSTLVRFAINENLKRRHPRMYWKLKGLSRSKKKQPKISILIPNKDHRDLLEPCVASILRKTTYSNYEIVIVDNGSTQSDILAYYEDITQNSKVQVIKYPEDDFNFHKIINYGAKNCDGSYILLLNNDTQLLTDNWLEFMVDTAQDENVGAVSSKLYYPDMRIQHLGGTIYLDEDDKLVCTHLYRDLSQIKARDIASTLFVRNVEWVTGACVMISKDIFEKVGGMDEGFKVEYGDVDLCLKIRTLGKNIVVNPLVELIHKECATRGVSTEKTPISGQIDEQKYFSDKWRDKYMALQGSYDL